MFTGRINFTDLRQDRLVRIVVSGGDNSEVNCSRLLKVEIGDRVHSLAVLFSHAFSFGLDQAWNIN